MNRAAFIQIFNRLCVALREPHDDSGITQETYFEALSDLAIEDLQGGANLLMRDAGRRFFPTTAEWRDAARTASRDSWRLALPPAREQAWRHDCEVCEDTGWVMGLACDGTDQCGRTHRHPAHSYTRVCVCRATNATYQRHHQKGQA